MKYGNWGALQRDAGLWVPSWVSSRPLNSPGGAPPLWNVCYISRCCRRGPVRRQCQLVSAHSLVELAAGIIKLQTGFRPGVPPRGETARSSACQQLIRATLTPATRLHPHAIQTTCPHTTDHTTNNANCISTHQRPHHNLNSIQPSTSEDELVTVTPEPALSLSENSFNLTALICMRKSKN